MKRRRVLNQLMKLYDDRITYFGDDAKVGTPQILADKIEDYKTIAGADADFTQVYQWAKPVVERYKAESLSSSSTTMSSARAHRF